MSSKQKNAGQQLYPILSQIFGKTRVFQLVRRETATDKGLPYVVYTPVTTDPETSQDGYTGYDWSRVQIDIYHDSYDKLDSVAIQAIIAITGKIRPCEIGSRQHLYDNDSGLFRQTFDVEFFTEIPTPQP